MSYPAPTRADHLLFCEIEGWSLVRNIKGNQGHHTTYQFQLGDGRLLRTRISHPPNRTTYGKQMFAYILRDQLQVSIAEFWACVHDRALPQRGQPAAAPPDAIPVGLVYQLLQVAGLPEDQVRNMNKQQAIETMNEFWTNRDAT